MNNLRNIYWILAMCFTSLKLTGQVKIASVHHPMGDTCTGSFEIEIGTATSSLPLTFYVMQYLDTIEVRPVRSPGNYTFNGYCPGKYSIEMVNSYECSKPLSFEIVGCENSFDIQLIGKADDYYNSWNTGMIEIKAMPGTNYTYQWSNGETGSKISNLPSGNYTVTVTNPNTGCSKTTVYNVGSCLIDRDLPGGGQQQILTKDSFEIDLVGGIIKAGSNAFFTVRINRKGEQVFTPYNPGEMDVVWKVNEDVVDFNKASILINGNDNTSVTVSVSNGCFTKTITRNVITCNTTNQETLRNYFIKSTLPSCQETNSGTIIFNSYDLKVNIGRISIDGIALGIPIEDTFKVKNLPSGVHTVAIALEGSCIIEFEVFISSIPLELSYDRYDSNLKECVYNARCLGQTIGTKNTLPSLKPSAKGCAANRFCNGVSVETVKEEMKKVKGGAYWQILKEGIKIGFTQIDIEALLYKFSLLMRNNKNKILCQDIKYCPVTLEFQTKILSGLNPFTHPPRLFDQNGCHIIDCAPRPKQIYCDGDDSFFPDIFKKGPAPFPEPCFSKVESLAEAISRYNSGEFNFFPNFKFTALGIHLQLYEYDERRYCATVEYCTTNFKLINTNVESIECGYLPSISTPVTPVTVTIPTCEPYDIRRTFNSKTFNVNCKLKNNNKIFTIKNITTFGLVPAGEEKIITDSNKISSIIGSSIHTFDGYRAPRTFLRDVNNVSYIHHYNDIAVEDNIIPISNYEVIASAEDWDLNNSLMIEKTPSNYILSFQAGDSLIEKTMPLTLNIKSLKQEENKYFVNYTDNTQVLRVRVYDNFGNILFTINTSSIHSDPRIYNHVGNRFLATANYKVFTSSIPIKDITSSQSNSAISSFNIPVPSGEIIAAGLNLTGSRLTVFTGVLTNETYYDAYNYKLEAFRKTSTGYTSAVNKVITYIDGIPNKSQVHIEVDSAKNVYFLTQFKGSLNIGGTILTTQSGNQTTNNIAIVKMDSSLNILNSYIAKSNNEINISIAYLNKNMLFFGGMMKSDTLAKKIGAHTFYNFSKNQTVPYFSYILTDQFPQTINSSPIASSNAESGLKPMIAEKKRSEIYLDAYPNPFKDITTVSILSDEIVSLVVIDILGNVVSKLAVNGQLGNMLLQTKAWQSGTYFIKGVGKNGEVLQTKKIMKLE